MRRVEKIILTICLCYTSNVKSSKDFFKVEITQTVKTHVISSMMKKKTFYQLGYDDKRFRYIFFCQGISRNISETSGLRNFRFTVFMPRIYISPPVTREIFYLTELFVFRLEQ